jgi:hypothetical protein
VSKGPAGHEAMFLWVHDGGASGDTAFQWIADPGETLEDMEAHCEAKRTDMSLFPGVSDPDPFDIVSGNIRILVPWEFPNLA